jgi:branched-chain amino acid aminotransferase
MPYLDQAGDRSHAQPFDLRDRGLLLADGVFDTSMVIRGRMCFREAHVARLLVDARALGIEVDPARIDAAIDAALAEAAGVPLGALRVTVTRGPGARGLAPSGVGAPTIFSSFAPTDPARVFAPVRIARTSIRRNETSPASRHKTLAYLDSVLAAREAAAAGAEEALFLNTSGRLACCAASNVFLIRGDELITPPTDEGVLPGVIRAWALANARRAGLTARETPVTLEDAARADAAFVTSSLRLIAPAAGIAATASATPAVTRLMTLLCEDLSTNEQAPPFDVPR